jgi:1,4-dihydroxy-6-naphthoate synthase
VTADSLRLRIGHSPDPDDAFMYYALAEQLAGDDRFEIEHVLADIETLNVRARTAELEVTAVSAAAYPQLEPHYWIMRSGASMGRGYGPVLVAREPLAPDQLAGLRVAIPGHGTTANLLLRLHCPEVERTVVPFAEIPAAVAGGACELGLLIHEGQLTFGRLGLVKILDFGELWAAETNGLPLPLGLDLVRRDLGRETAARISALLRASIAHALQHEDEALAYALRFGRGIGAELGRRFVKMYVNEDTLDLGETGVAALEYLYQRAHTCGLLERVPALTLV